MEAFDDKPHQNSHHHDKRNRSPQYAKPIMRKQKAIQVHSTSDDESSAYKETRRTERLSDDTDIKRINHPQITNPITMDNNNQAQLPVPLPRTQIRFNVCDTNDELSVSQTDSSFSLASSTKQTLPTHSTKNHGPAQLIETLIVPSGGSRRKLSLQPVVGNQQLPNFSTSGLHQQPTTNIAVGGLGGGQANLLYQNVVNPGNVGVCSNIGAGNSSANSLNVNSNLLIPRKSVIGRLERSSFQTQRLSDVGVAFGQQLTAKMGLKLPASQERIVEQTRWLYLRYVFVKLRQHALPLRDLNLTKSSRARRAAALGETKSTLTNNTDKLISSSAPATATTMNTDAITNPFSAAIGSVSGGSVGGSVNYRSSGMRKRTAISNDLNTQELAILAAKMRNDENSCSNIQNSGSNNNYDSSNNQSTTLDYTSTFMSGGTGGMSPVSNKKFIMDPTINNQIFTVIWNIIRELRELKPEYYGDTIYELIGIEKFSSIQTLLDVQMTLCQEMTRTEISWCRITALFSLFGAMSLDCVRLGTPEHVGPILDGFIEFVERDLALWISQQGGWESFLYKYRAGFRVGQLASKMITIALPVFVWILLSMFKSTE